MFEDIPNRSEQWQFSMPSCCDSSADYATAASVTSAQSTVKVRLDELDESISDASQRIDRIESSGEWSYLAQEFQDFKTEPCALHCKHMMLHFLVHGRSPFACPRSGRSCVLFAKVVPEWKRKINFLLPRVAPELMFDNGDPRDVYCPNCGEALEEDMKRCHFCGRRIGW